MHESGSTTPPSTASGKVPPTPGRAGKLLPQSGDLRGTARLAVEGVHAVTDLVETVHGNVARSLVPLPPSDTASSAPDKPPTSGLTRLIYRSITAITGLTGNVLDRLLALLEADPEQPAVVNRKRETMLAILNGVIGDHLHDSDNPLAIQMSLRRHGRSLRIDAAAQLATDLATDPAQSTVPGSRIMLFVHGLCMHDLNWDATASTSTAIGTDTAQGDITTRSPAEALAAKLGYTAVYLHYNSGRHISHNGRELAERLDTLLGNWPVPVTGLSMIGHSMGGLVARSACHYARLEQQDWLQHLQQLVFLGTPHHGAPLERIGHQLDRLLQSNRFSRPFARIGQARSAGITDLRHGNVVDEDWLPHHRFAEGRDTRQPVPLPAGVRCLAVAGSSSRHMATMEKLSGDGLVPVASALGTHTNPALDLGLPAPQQHVVTACRHLQLLRHPTVWQHLQDWLG
ncbi:MAG: GPI inositol-deacylase [Gammaproteobacteria bacterium]|nr:GPI inositol-deacylase [Gammaproteobacteria bacterium]